MSSLGAPLPLRSALKQPSRPSSPTSNLASPNLSPQISRVALPPSNSDLAPTMSRTDSSGSIHQHHQPPPHGTTAPHSAFHHPGHSHLSNPIANANYTPKVSFDTFENSDAAAMFSFTLSVKSAGYKRSRNTRVFLCASSPDESGREALEWCLEALVQDGDELIVFRGVDEDVLDQPHSLIRDSARDLMLLIQQRSSFYDPHRKLSLVLEYIPGKITNSIDRLIALYRPDSLVVGTRGRGGKLGLMQGLGAGIVNGLGVGGGAGIGSVSKYCLSHSPVPVIVVRPGRKLEKAREKRRADPKRGKHFET
ncbi:hypothetical protein BJ165DRAFT_1346526 [Panaeolus papilionaceus]|nr:hypothetical protein BJ165DRAFT_1346526 [Panaeolus papilionaceus]